MAACCGVGVLFESEGVHLHCRAITVGGTAQDSVAGGVIDVELCVVGAGIPTDDMVKLVVGQRGSGATVGAFGDVARRVVTAAVDQGGLIGAGGATAIDAGQFVRLGVAVQVLLLRTGAVDWPFPELAPLKVLEKVAESSFPLH